MSRRKRRWNTRQLFISAVGLLITLTLFLSLFVGFSGNDPATDHQTPQDADVVITQAPELPAPVTNVEVTQPLLHRTGLFEVPLPDGWGIFHQPANEQTGALERSGNNYDPNNNHAEIIISGGERLSVVHAYMQLGVNYEDMQAVSENLFTPSYFESVWAQYNNWTLTERTVGNTFLTIDFELVDQNDLTFFGRHISWQDFGHLFNLRFVVPSNNPDLLASLQQLYIEKFIYYPHMLEATPLRDWATYSDLGQDLMIKVPEGWEVVAGGQGGPTTLALSGDTRLQVTVQQFEDVTLSDAAAAEDWLATYREQAAVFEGRPVSQRFGDGFWYSYTFTTPDGDVVSAALAVFNNHQGGINVAEVRLSGHDGNLLAAEAEGLPATAQQILASFTLMAPDDYVYIEQPVSRE